MFNYTRTFRKHHCISNPDTHRGSRLTDCHNYPACSAWDIGFHSSLWLEYYEIRRRIIEECQHPDLTGAAIETTFCLIGPREQRLRPFVILHCCDEKLYERAFDLVSKSPAWKDFKSRRPHFKLMALPEAPGPLGSQAAKWNVCREGDRALHLGATFAFTVSEGQPTTNGLVPTATVGPCLKIRGERFFLSASHPLQIGSHETYTSTPAAASYASAAPLIDDDDDDDDEFDCGFDSSDDDEAYSLISGLNTSSGVVSAPDHSQHRTYINGLAHSSPTSSNGFDSTADQNLPEEDYIHASTLLPQLDADWITDGRRVLSTPPSRIPSPDSAVSNDTKTSCTEPKLGFKPSRRPVGCVKYSSTERKGYEHDWCLIKSTSNSTGNELDSANVFHDPRKPSRIITVRNFGVPPQNITSVLIVSQNNTIIPAKLMPTFSHYKLPGSKTFLRVLRIHTTQNLQQGDSGSAVIDASSYAFYGHIIAGYEGRNIALMVSICDVRGDIAQQLGVDLTDITLAHSDFSPNHGSDLRINYRTNHHKEQVRAAEFRVFELLPQTDTLACRIESVTVPADTHQRMRADIGAKRQRTEEFACKLPTVQYTALSYAWSSVNVDPGHRLVVYEESCGRNVRREVAISRNLEHALRSIRGKLQAGDRSIASRLWCDAVCIDQTDSRDRAQQMSLMSAIFGAATSVVAWLGDEDASSHQAMSFISSLETNTSQKRLPTPAVEDLRSVANLCRRDYFSRLWVVQEIALARNTVLLCGRDMVPWEKFADFSVLSTKLARSNSHGQFNKQVAALVCSEANRIKATLGMRLVQVLEGVVQNDPNGRDFYNLETLPGLVTTLSEFRYTDARDLDAILSLATNSRTGSVCRSWSGTLEYPRHYYRVDDPERKRATSSPDLVPIPVDYRTSATELLYRLVEHEILQGSLDIICLSTAARPEDLDASAPSWLPNNSRSPFVTHNGEARRVHGDAFAQLHSTQKFRACGSTTAKKARREGRNLMVNGWQIDSIREVGEVALDGTIPGDWLQFSQYDRNGESNKQLWRVLIARSPADSGCSDAALEKAYKDGVAEFPQEANIHVSELATSQNPEIESYWSSALPVVFNRRLFSIGEKQNMRFGLGPKDIRVGDVVCVLHGCSVPVILRREGGGSYCLVGESYLYGTMSGEAYEEAKDGRLESTEFVIR